MQHSPKSKPTPNPKSAVAPSQFRFDAIGTSWTIDLYQPAPAGLQQKILDRIAEFDKAYSRFRADSLITTIKQRPGTYQLPADSLPLFNLYRRLYDLTEGSMTPLIGSVLEQAGYDAEYSLEPGELHVPPTWDKALRLKGQTLTTLQSVTIDVGAAGKGYLLDIIGELLRGAGVTAFCLDAGGDILIQNPNALTIGLENPDDLTQVIGVVSITNGSICGSAGNRRSWAGYQHIINPHSLVSPTDIKAVWVVAPTGLVADALTTALYFAKPELLQEHFAFSYAILSTDGSLRYSANFPAEFFETHS
ncbi:MAG: FAD:protein transferase [Candidatus Saccharibacteria bacterium]|nr:FAD:protein transferase [Candidatus Saccharibacteria bacterium]